MDIYVYIYIIQICIFVIIYVYLEICTECTYITYVCMYASVCVYIYIYIYSVKSVFWVCSKIPHAPSQNRQIQWDSPILKWF